MSKRKARPLNIVIRIFSYLLLIFGGSLLSTNIFLSITIGIVAFVLSYIPLSYPIKNIYYRLGLKLSFYINKKRGSACKDCKFNIAGSCNSLPRYYECSGLINRGFEKK